MIDSADMSKVWVIKWIFCSKYYCISSASVQYIPIQIKWIFF